MNEDFEKYWLGKFSRSIEDIAGKEIKDKIMAGSEGLSDSSDRNEVISWSRKAMEELDELVDAEQRAEIMARCACQYPKSELEEIRKKYEETRSVELAHGMLQKKFVSFLKDTLNLDTDLINEIIDRGWGVAGRLEGNKIIATKIPKSGYLMEYMKETDPVKKRAIYCHCPRIRDALKTGVTISPTYCYCGAGFYKGIWGEILQKPVKVEMLESVMKGDDVCKIAISLP
jgi:predicted hydrocarbon binding protein